MIIELLSKKYCKASKVHKLCISRAFMTALFLLFLASISQAEIYTWQDKNGRVVYSDRPLSRKAENLRDNKRVLDQSRATKRNVSQTGQPKQPKQPTDPSVLSFSSSTQQLNKEFSPECQQQSATAATLLAQIFSSQGRSSSPNQIRSLKERLNQLKERQKILGCAVSE